MSQQKKYFLLGIFLALISMAACSSVPGTASSGDTNGGSGTASSQVIAPDFTPSGGIYNHATNIILHTSTSGAVIHYTTNGSDPTTASPVYATPIPLGNSMTVKACAVKSGMADSSITSAGYVINLAGTVSAPTFLPAGGTFDSPQTVTIASVTPNADIFYTLNGTTPTSNSTKYISGFTVSTALTIKAIAYKTNLIDSSVSSADFSFTPSVPVVTPDSGTFDSAQTVSISCGTSGSSIYFSTNNGFSYQAYTAPFSVNGHGTQTVKAYSVKSGLPNSATVSKNYTFRSWTQIDSVPVNLFNKPHSMVIDSLNRVYLSIYNDSTSSGTQCASIYRFDGSWSNPYNQTVYNQPVYYQLLAVKANNDVVDLFSEQNFKGSVHEYDGSTWHWIGSNISYSMPGTTHYQAAIDLDQYGVPYVAFKDDDAGGMISVTKCAGNVWQVLGNRGFASIDNGLSLAVAPDGTPYVNVNNGGMWIMKFDGTNWVYVGSQAVALNNYYEASIAVDSFGTPYVATGGNGSHKLNVFKYTNGNWAHVGGVDLSEGCIYYPKLKFSSQGVLYISYYDYSYSYTRLMKFNGTNWAAIGLPGDLPGVDCFGVDANGVPYVAYSQTDASYNTRVTLWRLNP